MTNKRKVKMRREFWEAMVLSYAIDKKRDVTKFLPLIKAKLKNEKKYAVCFSVLMEKYEETGYDKNLKFFLFKLFDEVVKKEAKTICDEIEDLILNGSLKDIDLKSAKLILENPKYLKDGLGNIAKNKQFRQKTIPYCFKILLEDMINYSKYLFILDMLNKELNVSMIFVNEIIKLIEIDKFRKYFIFDGNGYKSINEETIVEKNCEEFHIVIDALDACHKKLQKLLPNCNKRYTVKQLYEIFKSN